MCCLCIRIYKMLDILVFSERNEKTVGYVSQLFHCCDSCGT